MKRREDVVPRLEGSLDEDDISDDECLVLVDETPALGRNEKPF